MAPGRERPRLGLDMGEQGVDADPAVGTGTRAALEPRQHEQVGDEVAHALGLLRHQRDHALLLCLVERQVAQGLEEARQHGQRRADLVRDVGDEIAPHRLGALALGQVLRQDELEVAVVAADRHLQRARAARRVEGDGLVELAGLQVGDERRRANQVGDALAPVALRIEAEVIGGARVAPLDLVAGVEEQDAVRRRFHGGEELRQAQALGLGRRARGRAGCARCDSRSRPRSPASRGAGVSWAPRSQRSRRQPRIASKTMTAANPSTAPISAPSKRLAFAAQQAGDEAAGEHRQQADCQALQQPGHRCRVRFRPGRSAAGPGGSRRRAPSRSCAGSRPASASRASA